MAEAEAPNGIAVETEPKKRDGDAENFRGVRECKERKREKTESERVRA